MKGTSQYIIFLTNGEEENSYLITSDKKNAIVKLSVFRENIKRNDAWFELREYENENTNEYIILDI